MRKSFKGKEKKLSCMPPYKKKSPIWRTKKNGKHYPLSSRKRKYRDLPKIGANIIKKKNLFPSPINSSRVKKGLINTALKLLLRRTPIINEIQSAYAVADTIYDNWSTIEKLYGSYEKGGVDELAILMGTKVTHDTLSDIQTSIIWSNIKNYIPSFLKPKSRKLLSNLLDRTTTKETDFVKYFLSIQRKGKKVNALRSKGMLQNYESKKMNWPRGTEYV